MENICLICGKEIDKLENSIKCLKCDRWLHKNEIDLANTDTEKFNM